MTRHVGLVCGCDECVEWNVATEPQRRIPAVTGRGARWIHGRELRQWLDAKARFDAEARAALERQVSGDAR